MKIIKNKEAINLMFNLKLNEDATLWEFREGFRTADVLDYLRDTYHFHISMTPYSRKGFLVWECSIYHLIRFNSTYNSFMPNINGVGDEYDVLIEDAILKVMKAIMEVEEFDLGTVLNGK